MLKEEAEKLLQLYEKSYSIFHGSVGGEMQLKESDGFVRGYDAYCHNLVIMSCDVEDFTVTKVVENWREE